MANFTPRETECYAVLSVAMTLIGLAKEGQLGNDKTIERLYQVLGGIRDILSEDLWSGMNSNEG